MDVGEIMSFKPVTAPKRPAPGDEPEEEEEMEDDPNDSYEKRAAKRRKRNKAEARKREQERLAALEAEAANINSYGNQVNPGESDDSGLSAEQRKKIRELVDNADDSGEANLDEGTMKKLILNFEKRALKNQELRIKFPEEPKKFLESEVELHDAIQDLRALATSPDLYPFLVDLGCVSSFLGLLSHSNTDIAVSMVELIQELTDVDALTESEAGAKSLVGALMDNQISPLLIHNLERLNDSIREESNGIHSTLAIFENLIEFRPEVATIAPEAGLLTWLMKKLKVKVAFDDNKLYASEILSIFLQNEPSNRQKYGEMSSAIDSLLQQLAYYKRHNPTNAEEQEMMENLFDCLCSLLLHSPNREKFLKGEGLQLMNLMLREKKVSRNGALKVLNHALIGPEGKELCAKFVDILGLRTIFPLFMKTPKRSKRKGVSIEEHEEHVISIVASLVKNCRASQRTRLLNKFTESDHEKVERLMEMHFKYLDRVEAADERIKREGVLDDDEAYLEKLDSGLFSLQLIDFIIAEACANGPSSIKQRTLQIMNQRNASVTTIRNVLREYAGNLGDDGEKATESPSNGHDNGDKDEENGKEDGAKEQERLYLLHLVDKF